jgi:N-acetylglucosaminyldiphosphoundecaprenol N-acetyl-beta-D-mannosaminyltransferase
MSTHAVLEKNMTAATAIADDFSRDVYGLLGIPLDCTSMPGALQRIDHAAAGSAPFLLSTPNLNYLIAAQADREFRESLLLSDLCPPDGMPVVWIARLLGIPVQRRIAGSDIFASLRSDARGGTRLPVFLLGGGDGVAEAVREKINKEGTGLVCVGALNPGFGTVEDMSADHIFATINASGAKLLAVSMGAKKAQSWLLRNRARLRVPVRAHFGATINFEAGTVRRAPSILGRLGLEWLWRIKEEPHLWRRYRDDGIAFLRLVFTRAIPLRLLMAWYGLGSARSHSGLEIHGMPNHENAAFRLSGMATARHVHEAVPQFRAAVAAQKNIAIDMSALCVIDARFIGCLLMIRKRLESVGGRLVLHGASPRIARIFRLSGFGFLLSAEEDQV